MRPHHHLDDATLMSLAAGALAMPLAVVASAHLERCAECRQRLRAAEAIGAALLEQTQPDTVSPRRDALRDVMLARLESEAVVDAPKVSELHADPAPVVDSVDPDRLPTALHPYFGERFSAVRWRWIGPGMYCTRARDMPSLIMLKIAPGKSLPVHSHGGSELTQVLQGSYNDSLGLFTAGDVADLDQDVEHQPVTAPGVPCICVSALDAPLVFSGWLARKLQRFVQL